MTFEDKFNPTTGGHRYALELVDQISRMNSGHYLDPNIENGMKTNFCIGVAGYPEKHFESPNLASDLHFTKEKIKAGASYIVTQMFFDTKKYLKYVETCRAQGITVPIVPGLKPLTKKYQLKSIPRKFFVDMPDDLVRAVEKAKDDRAVTEVGIEWCVQQSKELKAAGVPCLHYYTMSDNETVRRIVSEVI
jgi:methylenetetrahydrofolate reductase (NADPH)